MSPACLYSQAGQFESYLVANPEDRFSRDVAPMVKSHLSNFTVITAFLGGIRDCQIFTVICLSKKLRERFYITSQTLIWRLSVLKLLC